MKINKSFLLGICLVISAVTASASTEPLTKENIHTKSEAEIRGRMEVLERRIEEIQAMDLSKLNRAEKKALRMEVKEIKKEAGLDDKVTISVGALIIIVLLLIIIF